MITFKTICTALPPKRRDQKRVDRKLWTLIYFVEDITGTYDPKNNAGLLESCEDLDKFYKLK